MTRPTHEKPELRDRRHDIQDLKSEQPYNGVNFSALFQAIPLPVYIWQKRGNDFVLIGYNKVSEVFTKGIIASLVGNKVSEMYSDMPDVLEDFSRCFTEKKSVRREMHYKMRTTGEYKHFAVWYAYVPPDIVLVHTEDIDKRKQAEETLNTYKQIVSTLSELMSCLDKNYRYLAVNDAYLKTFPDKSRENIIGNTPADLIGEESFRKKIKPNIDRCFKGEIVNYQDEFEFPGMGKRYMDVNYYPIFAKGKSVSEIVHISRDITERRLVEKALRESEEKLAGVLAAVTDHVSMIDDQHNIIWANDFAKKLFGKNIVGRKCYNTYRKYNKPCKKCIVRKCFKDGKIYECERETITADGGQKTFWCTASVAKRDKNGRPVMVVEVARDITIRKKAENKLNGLNNELERRVEARTSELLKTTKELQNRQEELLRNKLELEKVNQELLDTNNAISVLARNIDKNREESEKKIALTVNSNIIPIIENLKKQKHIKDKTELDIVLAYLNDITSNLLKGTDIIVRLSSAEMRVAAMIMNGLTSKEIAKKLYISLDTVKTHRRNIRKKLKIHNLNINLANYLRQQWGLDQRQ